MNPERSSVMTAHYIPCVGHLGLISYFASWTGGYRAMGKIADEAKAIYDKALQLDEMVVICVALECIPQELAALISKKSEIYYPVQGRPPLRRTVPLRR